MISTLETERLHLRPFEPEDLDALVELQAQPSYWWYPLRRAMTPEESSKFLDRVIANSSSTTDPALHAVIVKASGSLAGYAGLSVPNWLPEVLPAVEVGWRLGEQFRGLGFAREAAKATLHWGFNVLNLTEILSIFESENVASGEVMDHLGFGDGELTVDPHFGVDILVRRLSAAKWNDSAAATD